MFKKSIVYFVIMCFCMISMVPCAVSFSSSKKVTLSNKSVSLKTKEAYRIKLKGAESEKVKWSSSNKKIVTVNKGLIKAKKIGKCIVFAKYRGKKYSCFVQVKDKKAPTSTSTPTETPTQTPTQTPMPTPASPYASDPVNNDKLQLVVTGFSQDTKVISYTITNDLDEMVTMPTFVLLEKYDGQNWLSVPRTESAVTADAMIILPHSKADLEKGLSTYFSDLSSGKYRLCIQTSAGKIGAEFIIN